MNRFSRFAHAHLGAFGAAAAAVIVVVAGTLFLTVGSGSGTPASVAPSSTTTPPLANGAKHSQSKTQKATKGQITAISGGSWQIKTAHGDPVTVTISPQTQFGTKKAPVDAASFAVGDNISVAGTRNGATVTASRIAVAHGATPGATATTSTTQPANG